MVCREWHKTNQQHEHEQQPKATTPIQNQQQERPSICLSVHVRPNKNYNHIQEQEDLVFRLMEVVLLLVLTFILTEDYDDDELFESTV
jgi:hypothetical protein